MKSIKNLLDVAKAKTGSDAKTAAALGLHRASVSHWRIGTNAPNPDHAWRLAELLGEEPSYVIAICEAARAIDGERRDWIERVTKLGARTCVAAVIGASSIMGVAPEGRTSDALRSIHYALSGRRGRLSKRFMAAIQQLAGRQTGQQRLTRQLLTA